MGLIIISGVLMIIFIAICFIIDDYHINAQMFCGIISFLSTMIFIVSLCGTINLQRRFDKNIANYNSIKEVIEYNRSEMSEFERVQLIEEIQETNKTINEHRYYYDNFWTGIYYSKEIGDLKYLK